MNNHLYVIYAGSSNIDALGSQVPYLYTRCEVTAERTAAAYLKQGLNGQIEIIEVSEPLFGSNGYITIDKLHCIQPTREDIAMQATRDATRKKRERLETVLAKAREKGLSAEEILLLRSSPVDES